MQSIAPSPPAPPRDRSALMVFGLVCALALGWALYTQHAWEDYYITYRASKNLATGQGLTFTAGERVHSFTSPLGVLLPAAASLLTGNRSDDAALWIFRAISIAALAGAGVLLWRTTRILSLRPVAGGLLLTLFALDAKNVDFSTNGMETGFMLLFLAWYLRWLFQPADERSWRQLGLAWAGLMWTRPDSFIHIGLLAAATFVFLPLADGWRQRRIFLRQCLAAGLLCTVLYLPWLLWAAWYYGSPIPHTIVAKGFGQSPPSLTTLGNWLGEFPGRIVSGNSTLATTFLPHYAPQTGWPARAVTCSNALAMLTAVVWLLPFVPWRARVTSLGFLLVHFYLTFFASYPFPWYVPPATLLAYLTMVIVADRLLGQFGRPARWIVVLFGFVLAGASALVSIQAARQLYWQQRLIEFGLRREIGRFLHDHAASPRDTVFLEPLGYIGYYSGLKMYDWPGLSSPEVIAARRKIVSPRAGVDLWPELIRELRPTWLVLRPFEAGILRRLDPALLQDFYQPYHQFDASPAVRAHADLWGHDYLTYDERFEIFQRTPPLTPETASARGGELRPITLENLERQAALVEVRLQAEPLPGTIFAHAPSALTIRIPPGATGFAGKFGLLDGAFANPAQATDGADFRIECRAPDGTLLAGASERLNPTELPADRPPRAFAFQLPPAAAGGTVELTISIGPHGNGSFDWTYWSQLNFIVASRR